MNQSKRRIRVLIVEDSPAVGEFLSAILNSYSDIDVVGTAHDGEAALEAVRREKPDVITVDIHMPKINGFEAARRIMEMAPVPIVIVSGSQDTEDIPATFRAIEAGALAVVRRPAGPGHPDHEATAKELLQMVQLMSEVKVVRRWARAHSEEGIHAAPPEIERKRRSAKIQLVAIGASAGGPLAIQTVLSRLPKHFSVPVLIVQHMAEGFIQGFVKWLDQSSELLVHVAADGESLLPGHVYIAPDGFQMGVAVEGIISLTKDEPESALRPSVSYLFRSIAQVFGEHAVGVLLTGMGKDGAEELRLLREKGGVAIVQDKESSVVHGMPGEAIRLNAATYVLSLDRIASSLVRLVDERQAPLTFRGREKDYGCR